MEPITNTRLKAFRVLRGFTQKDLACKLGRSQSWLCRVERGLTQPSDLDVALICRVLDVKPEFMFDKADHEHRPGMEVFWGKR